MEVRSAGIALIMAVVLELLFQESHAVRFEFLEWRGHIPLSVLVIGSVVLGWRLGQFRRKGNT